MQVSLVARRMEGLGHPKALSAREQRRALAFDLTPHTVGITEPRVADVS